VWVVNYKLYYSFACRGNCYIITKSNSSILVASTVDQWCISDEHKTSINQSCHYFFTSYCIWLIKWWFFFCQPGIYMCRWILFILWFYNINKINNINFFQLGSLNLWTTTHLWWFWDIYKSILSWPMFCWFF